MFLAKHVLHRLAPLGVGKSRRALTCLLVLTLGLASVLLASAPSASQGWTASWTQKANPPWGPREEVKAAFDTVNAVAVLFGPSAPQPLSDVWQHDVGTDRWTQLESHEACPSNFTPPTGREDFALEYDSINQLFWMFGGSGSGCNGPARMARLGTTPSAIVDPALSAGTLNFYKDWTVTVNGTTGYVSTYNPVSKTLFLATPLLATPGSRYSLYPQRGGGTFSYSTVTRIWGGLTGPHWKYTGPSPSNRLAPAMAYSTRDTAMVMFGGEGRTDTWALDSETKSWVQMISSQAAGSRPGLAQLTNSMTYDSDNDVFILFGGCRCTGDSGPSSGDTWAYRLSTNTWTKMTPAVSPPPRQGHNLVYDSKNKVVVLFGGVDTPSARFYNDLWIYSYATNAWTQLFPSTSPPGRRGGGMVYDPVNQRAVLYGGTGHGSFRDVWALQLQGPSTANPVPALTSLSSDTATVGGSAFTLTVSGANFLTSSVVRWNGVSRSTTYVRSTQLQASIPATDIASVGTAQVSVVSPGPGGGTSNALAFTVTTPPPSAPTLTSISPTTVAAGGPAVTVAAAGTSFSGTSVLQVNGSSRTTTAVSATQLTATVLASDIAASGTLKISVFTPAPGGGTSAGQTLTVSAPPPPVSTSSTSAGAPATSVTQTAPAPTLTSISPTTAAAGGPAVTLTATGTNFAGTSALQINGYNRTTTVVSQTQLTATVLASDIAAAGALNVSVFTPAPGGGTSAGQTLTVSAPPPTASTSTAPTGGSATTTPTVSVSSTGTTSSSATTPVTSSGPVAASTVTSLRGDCSSEGGLAGRSDIVFCESWEDPNWWQNGYHGDGTKSIDRWATSADVARATVVSTGCISGNCLRIDMLKGETRALAVHWPLKNAGLAPEELYLRYYMKLSPNFNPYSADASGQITGDGGKFPGLADVRTSSDPSGQCGNGGDPGDGINCWSMRLDYYDCHPGAMSACALKNSNVRIGSYLYFYRQQFGDGSYTGHTGSWDGLHVRQFTGDGGTCQTVANNTDCGIGTGGILANDQWYRVEMRVKMNTPGQADGIIQGWVDGVLSYEKTNMIFRIPGHDNLHNRTVWLDVYKGGIDGNYSDQQIYLDQMVVALNGVPGPWVPAGASASAPTATSTPTPTATSTPTPTATSTTTSTATPAPTPATTPTPSSTTTSTSTPSGAATVTLPPAGTWAALPGTALAPVVWKDAQGRSVNELKGGDAWYTILNMWNGAAYRYDTDTMVFPALGGHSGGADNSVYSVNMGIPKASRDVDPTVDIIPSLWQIQANAFPRYVDTIGEYGPAGSAYPSAAHRYDGMVHIEGTDYIWVGGGPAWGASTSTSDIFLWDTKYRKWTWMNQDSLLSYESVIAATYDPVGKRVLYMDTLGIVEWVLSRPAGQRARRLLMFPQGQDSSNRFKTLLVDVKRNRLVAAGVTDVTTGASQILYWDLTTLTAGVLTPSTGAFPAWSLASPGFDIDVDNDRYLIYSGGNTLTWVNPATGAITLEQTTGAPAVINTNGTWGRMRYSRNLKAVIFTQDMWAGTWVYKVQP